METLHLLLATLAISAAAGVNLYLAVFAASVALRFGWLALPAGMGALEGLNNPWVIAVAGVLYILQFLANRIFFLRHLNNFTQTIAAPVLAASVPIRSFGEANPAVMVAAVVVAVGAAGTVSVAKTRLHLGLGMEGTAGNTLASIVEDAIALIVMVLPCLSLVYAAIVAGMLAVLFRLVWRLFSWWRRVDERVGERIDAVARRVGISKLFEPVSAIFGLVAALFLMAWLGFLALIGLRRAASRVTGREILPEMETILGNRKVDEMPVSVEASDCTTSAPPVEILTEVEIVPEKRGVDAIPVSAEAVQSGVPSAENNFNNQSNQ